MEYALGTCVVESKVLTWTGALTEEWTCAVIPWRDGDAQASAGSRKPGQVYDLKNTGDSIWAQCTSDVTHLTSSLISLPTT